MRFAPRHCHASFAIYETSPPNRYHLSHLLHALLVEDFLDGDELDDAPALLVQGGSLGLAVGGVVEGDEEALGAVFALHDGFERVDVGAGAAETWRFARITPCLPVPSRASAIGAAP
jgi:hypothetical protein